MFNLSFLIYKLAENEDVKLGEIKVDTLSQPMKEIIEKKKQAKINNIVNVDVDKNSIATSYMVRDSSQQLLEDNQISTASVKIVFNTQGMTIRFSQHHIMGLFTRYFVANNQIMLSDKKLTNEVVKNLFSLNLYDPYLYSNDLWKIRNEMSLTQLFESPDFSNQIKSLDKILTEITEDCRGWTKTFNQKQLALPKTDDQLRLLKQIMSLDVQLNSPWKLEPVKQQTTILVESKDFFRPPLSNNKFGTIYDAIVWNKTHIDLEDPEMTIELDEYLKSNLKLSNIIEDEKEVIAIIDDVKKLDKQYNGSTFIEDNSTFLIDDGIVPSVYYLCLLSRIIDKLHNYIPFQMRVAFIYSRIVSIKGENVKEATFIPNDCLKRKHFSGEQTFQQDLSNLMGFIHNICGENVKYSTMNIIIDRRYSTSNSTKATIYAYYTNHKSQQIDQKQQQEIMNKLLPEYSKEEIIGGINKINKRISWKTSSSCLIYSRKHKEWYKGTINDVLIDPTTNVEWVSVSYQNTKKRIQRFCEQIKPTNDTNDTADNHINTVIKLILSELKSKNIFNNVELAIKNMNSTVTIPNINKEQQSNPHLLYVNFYHFKRKEIKAYCIRNNCCIRFFPEVMMNIWPHLFYGNPRALHDIVYQPEFRHSFSVGLHDEEF
eukprot:55297_1